MSKIKISMRHEGKCSICKKNLEIITIGNVETRKVAYICEECSKKSELKTEEFVEKYGEIDEEPFKGGFRIIPGHKAG